MENKKTEKKRIFSKLTVCVAALALVSCAFVGGTFARYTTQGEVGNGGANVADWYIDVVNGSGNADATLTISPYELEYGTTGDGLTEGDRTNVANAGGTILTFVNRGEVAAQVTVTISDTLVFTGKKPAKTENIDPDTNQGTGTFTFTWEEYELAANNTYTDANGNTFSWDAKNYRPVFNDATLNTYWEDVQLTGPTESTTKILTIGDVTVTGVPESDGKYVFELQPGAQVSVSMGPVTWRSDFATDDDDGSKMGVYGDIRDTWIGQNISEVGYQISWEAVQISHVPSNGTVTGGGTTTPSEP